ncbi:MAG: (2Fe-2S)-binding protein [Deltaproteobacteria bacterium]|nr:(2Fe-2S)-binding protein [Deltaproteobacteria bacterium]
MKNIKISFVINGKKEEREIPPNISLLKLLRDHLGLTGTKNGCEAGECGACTVLLDGRPVYACLVLAPKVDGKEIITIEGIGEEGKLHAVQKAFLAHGAVQCGFCTPGMILAAKALLDERPNPSRKEIEDAISGNLCRCTGYLQIVKAIEASGKGGKGEV